MFLGRFAFFGHTWGPHIHRNPSYLEINGLEMEINRKTMFCMPCKIIWPSFVILKRGSHKNELFKTFFWLSIWAEPSRNLYILWIGSTNRTSKIYFYKSLPQVSRYLSKRKQYKVYKDQPAGRQFLCQLQFLFRMMNLTNSTKYNCI